METLTRNQIILDGWVLEKLDNQEDILSFDCGDSDLNEYFRVDNVQYRKELMTQSYCFYRVGQSQRDAVALVDFCNDSLARNFITKKSKKEIHHQKRGYKSFPALKITRLGVDKDIQHAGVGKSLLTVIKHFFVSDNRTGCRFLTVDAYRCVKDFYIANGFIEAFIPEEDLDPNSPTIPMYYDLKRLLMKSP